MSGLLGPNGKPISSSSFENKKAAPPRLGEQYGQWAGENVMLQNLPGGGTIAFDTSKLTLADFRQMRGHYQINSSLSILTFMMHQMDFHVESPNKKAAELVENQLRNVWSHLVRAMSQSFWAGYAPNVLQWENDYTGREVVLKKVKDLIPENSRVDWKDVQSHHGSEGVYTHKVYDGIKQWGSPKIPVDNSFWYPLLMENGNYYGRRLLESAFQPWFFSTLLHLFANRYYERFGEPTPIGRAPYDDEVDVSGQSVPGNELMKMVLQNIRNRSVAILPNTKTQQGSETTLDFDYQVEYLESQMRGADFERYMTRLDEEMSLAMFTPILMMRTADVGSYNLGTQHTQVYQWMLNAISGDWAFYINKYIIAPIVRYNFNGRNIPVQIKFTKMGKTSAQLLQTIIQHLLTSGTAKIDVREIGQMAGLSMEEIEQVVDEAPVVEPEEQPNPAEENQIDEVKRLMTKRVRAQIEKSFRNGAFGTDDFSLNMGYRRQLEDKVRAAGYSGPESRVRDIYNEMDSWATIASSLGAAEWETADAYMTGFGTKLNATFNAILG